MVCIFLPLSQCRGQVEEGDKGDPTLTNNYIYGKSIVSVGIEGAFNVVVWVLPCILGLVVLIYGASIKLSVIQVVSGLLAGIGLAGVVVWSHQILWPAYLASACICLVVVLAFGELWYGVKKWHLTKSSTRTK